MLKFIKAHDCLCVNCNPDFIDEVYEQAHMEAQAAYEMSVSGEAKQQLYDAAIKKYKGEAESLAVRERSE